MLTCRAPASSDETTTPPRGPALWGVNLAGAEFGAEMPGLLGKTYIWPENASVDYYLGKGLKVIRLPFRWERLETRPGGEFRPADLRELDRLVGHIIARGAHVILDLHNFGRWIEGGTPTVIGEAGPASAADFARLWARLAARYRGLPGVVFGLMNEPYEQDTETLVRLSQGAILAIRATRATQLVLVPGNHYSGAHSWVSSGNAAAMLAIADPGANFAFDVHQYLDADSSGSSDVCVPRVATDRLRPFTDWARRYGRRGFLGEFNAGPDPLCLEEMASLLGHVIANDDVWLGAAYWAGGPWWGDVAFSIEPADLARPADRPQMGVLTTRLP